MTRVAAFEILSSFVKNPSLIRHHLACEAAMRAIYLELAKDQAKKEDEERWGIVGLLHDADYEMTKDNPSEHTILLEEKIGALLTPEIMHSIQAHNWHNNGVEPETPMDWAIYCCDELTGLIAATALVTKDKKIKSVTPDSVMKKFDNKSFAKGGDREQIKMCEEKLGIPLPEFINLILSAMQQIDDELGL